MSYSKLGDAGKEISLSCQYSTSNAAPNQQQPPEQQSPLDLLDLLSELQQFTGLSGVGAAPAEATSASQVPLIVTALLIGMVTWFIGTELR